MNAKSEYKTFKDLIQTAKDKPAELNLATIAVGSTQHLTSVLFKGEAGVDFRHVPFRNTLDALVSLIRDDTHLLIASQAALKSALEGQQVRALATSGPRRSAAMPDVPTVQEADISGFDVTSWNALFAPKGTPEPIIHKLNVTLKEILGAQEIKTRLLELGIDARSETPSELTARLRSDIEKWRAVIEKAGITCATLVMVGRQDRWSPLAQHEEMAARIPNAELMVIEDSGHMTLLDQPEQVSNALLRWLGFENEPASAQGAAATGN